MWVNHSGHSNFHIAKAHARYCNVSPELKWGARGEKQTIISAICSTFISKPWLLWCVRDDDYTHEYCGRWSCMRRKEVHRLNHCSSFTEKRLFISLKIHKITPFIDAHRQWSLTHYWGLIFREIIMKYQGQYANPVNFFLSLLI